MGIFPVDWDSFNPRIFYVSREQYDHTNALSAHFHPFCVLMVVYHVEGTGKYRIEGKTETIREGMMVLCNPAVYHEKVLSPGSKIHEYHIAFDRIQIPGLPANCIVNGGSCTTLHTGSMKIRLENSFEELLEESEFSLPGSDAIIKAIASKIILLALRLAYNDSADCPLASDSPLFSIRADKKYMVEYARRYMSNNFHRPIRIGSIAENLHVSHVYLSRIFRQEFGESPVSYLTKLRLNMARELLTGGHCTVKSAARSAGYDDSSHFSRHFKKHFGKWPSEYLPKEQS